jgi:hypothetical protein
LFGTNFAGGTSFSRAFHKKEQVRHPKHSRLAGNVEGPCIGFHQRLISVICGEKGLAFDFSDHQVTRSPDHQIVDATKKLLRQLIISPHNLV